MTHPVPWRVLGSPEGASWGTGWGIGPRLAVTAAHVVPHDAVEVHAAGERYVARRRAVEQEYDVAVLDLPAALSEQVCPCRSPRDGAPATVIGWPRFATEHPAGLEGRLSASPDGGWALRVSSAALTDRSWEGLSGAPVWSEAAVVGLVTRVHPAHGVVRVASVEQFAEMLPRPLQPLPVDFGSDPRGAQLATARNELLRGTSNRGLMYVAAVGFEARRFGRALAASLRTHPDACEVVATGSLAGATPSLAARLLRAVAHDDARRGSATLRAQLALEGQVERAMAGGRRFVLHLQGLNHLSTAEAVELGNLLAAVCQHENFRIVATGGRRIRELQAIEFHQHSAFHEVAYPSLGGLKPHQCDRLVDGLGLPEGWMWSLTGGHPALSSEVAQLLSRGHPARELVSTLLPYSDFLVASAHRVNVAEELRAGCARLVSGGGTLQDHGYDRALEELRHLGLVLRDGDAWSWSAPLLQEWAIWGGLV